MGHSGASLRQVLEAAKAGLTLSTHLGNALPHMLPRTDNPLLGQLSDERIVGCFIADGHHLSPEVLGALLRIKGLDNSVLVTDAVLAAAAGPGSYAFAGMEIMLGDDGIVRRPGQVTLAGSSLRLDQAVRNVVAWGLATAGQAVRMASENPRRAIAQAADARGIVLPTGRVRWSEDLHPLDVSLKN
jgi:N-acetylglucosamine-6-phosphate deacetylase